MKNKPIVFSSALGFVAFALLYFVPAGGFVSFVCAFAAPTLFLYSARRCETRKQRHWVGIAFAAGQLVMNLHFAASVFLDIPVILLSAIYISLAYILDNRFCGPKRGFLSTLVFPAVWVYLFLIASLIHVGFQFRMDAYATVLRAFTQIDSLVGSVGFLFLLLWTGSVIVHVLENGKGSSPIGVSAWALVMLFSLTFGASRLSGGDNAASVVRAAYSTGPYVGDFVNYEELDYDSYVRSLQESTAKAAEGGAELLVFNEEAFLVPASREEEFSAVLSELCTRYDMAILSGEEVFNDSDQGGLSSNRVSMFDKDGQLVFRYLKHSLVPLIETSYMVAGDAKLPSAEMEFDAGTVKLSACICYDSNFPVYISGIPDDTQLLLIPSWDWSAVTDYHGEVARQLAIENGVTVLKVTYDGLTWLFSPTGETLHRTSTAEDGFAVVHFIDIPVWHNNTLYGNIGQCFSIVFCIATAAIMIFLTVRKKKAERRTV